MKALLIIDMQVGLFTPLTPRFDAHGVVAKVSTLAQKFREKGWPVIFIQHDGTSQNYLVRDTPDWEILPSLSQKSTDIIVEKSSNDAFFQTNLEETLQSKGITELVITGCATDICVDTTVRSALCHGYRVWVVEDGHTTGNRPHLDAQSIIVHHNWVWSQLSAANNRVEVEPFSEIIAEL